MRKMSQTNQTNETTEESLDWTNDEMTEFVEHVHSGFVSIHAILKKFKEDHYNKQETKDELDELLDEVNDSIECIGDYF